MLINCELENVHLSNIHQSRSALFRKISNSEAAYRFKAEASTPAESTAVRRFDKEDSVPPPRL